MAANLAVSPGSFPLEGHRLGRKIDHQSIFSQHFRADQDFVTGEECRLDANDFAIECEIDKVYILLHPLIGG